MEDFEKKVSISDNNNNNNNDDYDIKDSMDGVREEINKKKALDLLRQFLAVQQRRALAYAHLKRGFEAYLVSGIESAYQQLCSSITVEFNDCSKQVIEIESSFKSPDCCRDDLADLLRSVQGQEKQKLQLTATIQVLKKAGWPSERPVSHDQCSFSGAMGHKCVHIHKITEASGTEDAEADAEYDNAMKEAIKGVQDAIIAINENLEEVRYEIAALETQ
ncbi:hypothetical protein Leryth_023506 [Lithospermum erythrorhizon]|nr:hypothetical protein Leryth_023506 [Lithospermum erythrorhizon]